MKSNTKLYQLAKLKDLKSSILKDALNDFLKEDRYTSVNQFLLTEDLEIVNQIVAQMQNGQEEVKDELDKFIFSGMLYNYATGEYEPVLLEIPYDDAKKFIKHESESTAHIARANLRLERLITKHTNLLLDHPLAIRRRNGRK